jgi:hypothetical protein
MKRQQQFLRFHQELSTFHDLFLINPDIKIAANNVDVR